MTMIKSVTDIFGDLSIEEDVLEYKESLLLKNGYEINAIKVTIKVRNKLLRNISAEKKINLKWKWKELSLEDIGDDMSMHHKKLFNL